ncbi:hypothetical protein BX616_001203 [Lobosporangium transversale]|uniref:Uncharacterized protein n=1 Tax=Lobosporangium transversale TaxID=64571 RepID=A0A1Y2GJ31_9FUNG|nr:hypothetical protein BCR41DRAFT_387627 [Lobosporangium transversale]KAF9904790.1 hypothetical protein BX616_001203 [Lobosporangium transversale]ORZ12181.1 hypothetical protein BCR41DRAFT_387627 [Lobosporangium transversale]|eukprot:XP_021880046.1 hypothetical protein BCR41DRAFT_387627 [Lobosporangium transversale]
MSNPRLDLSSKDELISNLLSGNKASTSSTSDEDKKSTGERKTFRVQSDLLARLEDFLPKIKEANAQLEQQIKQDPKALDIENVDEESGEQYIEMDLGLGVFDLKKDIKEEDIIINPSDIKKDSSTLSTSPTINKKPAIVMMDMNDDDDNSRSSKDNDNERTTAHRTSMRGGDNDYNHDNDGDGDVMMTSS